MSASGSVADLRMPSDLGQGPDRVPAPFVIFEVSDFLPDDLYRRLEQTWPDPTRYGYDATAEGDKLYLDSLHHGFESFMTDNAEWRSLYEYFGSDSTARRLRELCELHLTSRPADERRPWRLVPPPSARTASRVWRRLGRTRPGRILSRLAKRPADTTDVFLGFEFSVLADGARIPPHTDTPAKLLSLMLYFPAPGQEQVALGTEFYSAKPGRVTATKWRSPMPDEEDTGRFFVGHECFYQSGFEARKLVGFIKSDVSWHGLGPVDAGPVGRRAVVINYFARTSALAA